MRRRPPPRTFTLKDPHPQPLAQGGVQRRESDWAAQSVRGTDEQLNEEEEREAARAWLRHVEAGRIGGRIDKRE